MLKDPVFQRIFLITFLGVGLGTFSRMFLYGITAGLWDKKILSNTSRNEYQIGRKAVYRGCVYIFVFGTMTLAVIIIAAEFLNRNMISFFDLALSLMIALLMIIYLIKKTPKK